MQNARRAARLAAAVRANTAALAGRAPAAAAGRRPAGRPVPLGPLMALSPSPAVQHAAAIMARRRPAAARNQQAEHAHGQPGDPASDVTLFQAAAAALPSLSPHALAAAIVAAGRQQALAQHQHQAAAHAAAVAAHRRRQQREALSAAVSQSACSDADSTLHALTSMIQKVLSNQPPQQQAALLSHPLFAGLLMQPPMQQLPWPPAPGFAAAGAAPPQFPPAVPGARALTEADLIAALSELAASNGASPAAPSA